MILKEKRDLYIMNIIRIGLILILFLPLLFIDNVYFPFVVTRNLFFRLIISFIFPLYLYLFLKDKKYWPQFNKGFVFLFLFIISLTISSILGGYFSFSFWSNFERMDGLVNWYFITLYIITLLGFLNRKKEVKKLFNSSIIAAILLALFSLAQQLNILNFSIFGLGGLLGNSAYLGSYMFLHIILAFYLLLKEFIKKDNKKLIIYYLSTIIFFLYTLIISQNRGSFLGLIVFIFFFTIFYLYFQRKEKNILYYIISSFLIVSFLFTGLLIQQKDSAWVKKVTVFNRLTNISLTDTTTQSRLVIWRNSLKGVKEKPFLGWGEENFIYVFNKYFPLEIYHDTGSETWFDRPHNIYILHLVQGGIIGLGLYLAIFISLIFLLYKRYIKDNDWLFNFFWLSFLIAFMFHNLFVFNNLNTNIVFYLILSYLFSLIFNKDDYKEDKYSLSFFKDREYLRIALSSTIFLLFFTIFFYLPFKSNKLLVNSSQGMASIIEAGQLQKNLDAWEKSFSISYLGDKEKVGQLTQNLYHLLNNPYLSKEEKTKAFNLTYNYLEKVRERYPEDVKFNIFLTQFYYNFYQVDSTFIDNNINLLNELSSLAPQRPDLYLFLADSYLLKNDLKAAQAIYHKLKDLIPHIKEIYWLKIKIDLLNNDFKEIIPNLENIKNINLEKRDIYFTDAEHQLLNNFKELVEKNNNQELLEYLNNSI